MLKCYILYGLFRIISITYVIVSNYLYFVLSIIYFDYIFAITRYKLSINQQRYMYIYILMLSSIIY